MTRILLIAVTTLLTACALPNTEVRSGSVRPTLAVKGAPDNAILFLDGLDVGAANQYNGQQKVLTIEEGPHRIEVKLDGRSIYSERLVITSGESRAINVGGGAK